MSHSRNADLIMRPHSMIRTKKSKCEFLRSICLEMSEMIKEPKYFFFNLMKQLFWYSLRKHHF